MKIAVERSHCTSPLTTGQLQRQNTRRSASLVWLIWQVLFCLFCYIAIAALITSTLLVPGHLAFVCFWAVEGLSPKVEWRFPREYCSMCMLQLLKGSVKWGLNGWVLSALCETSQVCIKQLTFIQWLCIQREPALETEIFQRGSTLVMSLKRYSSKLEPPFRFFHCRGSPSDS